MSWFIDVIFQIMFVLHDVIATKRRIRRQQ